MPSNVKASPDPFDSQDLFMTTHIVRFWVTNLPNDAELGKKVRELITNKYGVISKVELDIEIKKSLGES